MPQVELRKLETRPAQLPAQPVTTSVEASSDRWTFPSQACWRLPLKAVPTLQAVRQDGQNPLGALCFPQMNKSLQESVMRPTSIHKDLNYI